MTLTCIAVDDEPLALDILKDYCSKIPFLKLKATFQNPLEALDYLRNEKTDVLFLDIQMHELTGLQVVSMLPHKPYIIFTTAYDNFAIKGYELEVDDYLLKPISFERFYKAVYRISEKDRPVVSNGEAAEQTNHSGKENYVFIKTESRIQKVNFDDILFIEGMGDYLQIVTRINKIMTLMNFKNIEELLPENKFARIHKSYIVSIAEIDHIERNRIKIDKHYLPISETYRKSFFDLLKQKGVL